MIKLIITGGLGNQMFEYAAARSLAIKQNTSVAIDLYSLQKRTKATLRDFELNVFDINASIISSTSNRIAVKTFGILKSKTTGHRFLKILNIFRDEKAQFYDNEFEKLSNNTTLFGYFQNEIYFKSISDQLREDFRFNTPLKDKNLSIQHEIEQKESISIHIRRGDYTKSNSNLPTLDTTYYKKSIEYIISKIENPYFYIFSDEIDWVKENLDLKYLNHTFIDWNKNEDSYIDMQLMSLCKSNIIANSSFSWWGAWLNKNPEKLVIAPHNWYKKDIGTYPEGFLPKEWIIL